MVRQWRPGDRVVHAARPEWGVGEVRSAEPLNEPGAAGQRLTVRFARAGLKTLSTAAAELTEADDAPALDRHLREAGVGLLDRNESEAVEQVMTRLPALATDPFRPLRARFTATADLFRFERTGASLVDWAVMQSGLADPLTRFTRQELEVLFERFRTRLIEHLRTLATELARKDPATYAELLAAASPPVRRALKGIDARR